MDKGALASALREWETALGSAHVLSDSQSLRDASTATFQTAPQVQAIKSIYSK
jgi:hypothetical protein